MQEVHGQAKDAGSYAGHWAVETYRYCQAGHRIVSAGQAGRQVN
jgi:hypothetical protein